jgi:hypothetical protein
MTKKKETTEDNNDESLSLGISIPISKSEYNNKPYEKNEKLIKIPNVSSKSNNHSFIDDTFDIIDDDDDNDLIMKSFHNKSENKEGSSTSQNIQTLDNYSFKYQLNKLKKFNESNKKENEREEKYSNFISRKRKLFDEKNNEMDNNNKDKEYQPKIVDKITSSPSLIDIDDDDMDEVNFLLSPVFKKTKVNNEQTNSNKKNVEINTIDNIKNENIFIDIEQNEQKKDIVKEENKIISSDLTITESKLKEKENKSSLPSSSIINNEDRKDEIKMEFEETISPLSSLEDDFVQYENNSTKEDFLKIENSLSVNPNTIDTKQKIERDDKEEIKININTKKRRKLKNRLFPFRK